MLIKDLQVGQLETNCYIVTDEDSLSSAVIDPGGDSAEILDYIEGNHLKVKAIFLTHGHFDHTGALWQLQYETNADVYINRADCCEPPLRDPLRLTATPTLKYYGEGDTVDVGAMSFSVMETPGHSPGSVTLRCGEALFTGDTLFRDSCGRTDLTGGSMEVLLKSLNRLDALPGDFEVYPGHGGSSTLDRERRFNYYLSYARERAR